jgi:1,4-dihydroxy-6-naphthoate synthase
MPSGSWRVTIGHSPDADDAFMFYPLASGQIDTGGVEVTEVLQDIETLNQRCRRGELDVSAVSVHAYAYLADRYALLSCGASMGDGYGPVLVARKRIEREALVGRTIAIPGALTSATLALRLFLPEFEPKVVPFDRILETVGAGEADAGVVIHEGQLTFRSEGFHGVVDLGEWWQSETGLPLPLGVNVVRRDLGEERIQQVARLLRQSIDCALEHRESALDHAMSYARGLERRLADRFVGMYVNELTRDLGTRGRESIRLFLDRGFRSGIISRQVDVEFVDA